MILSCIRTCITLNIKQYVIISSKQIPLSSIQNSRLLSTKNIFGKIDITNQENLLDIPSIPTPQPIKQSAQEMYDAGLSVINELELFSWWKPTGYFRYALEYIHMNLDVPWWGTLMCGKFILLFVF